MDNPPNTEPLTLTIIFRLVLACKHIPESNINSCEEPYSHGLACRDLPKHQCLRDKWVHGIFYEIQCMLRAKGMLAIDGITQDDPPPFTLLVAILTTRHPCDEAVAEIAAEFARIFSYLENDGLPVKEDTMWWRDIPNASFPASTAYVHGENQSELVIAVRNALFSHTAMWREVEGMDQAKTAEEQKMLSLVSLSPAERV